MRLYIENYNIQKIKEKLNKLEEYLLHIDTYLETYSNEGMYYIKNNKIYKIQIIDNKIYKYANYYNNYTILLDTSQVFLEEEHQINYNHIIFSTTLLNYSLYNNSNIKLIIETNNKNDFIYNFYFEIPENIDIENKLFKDELIVFLSLLN